MHTVIKVNINIGVFMKKTFFLTLLFFMFINVSAMEGNTFKFTAIPDQDDTRLMERFDGIAKYLSKQLNVEVEYVPVKSYSASVAAFKNNSVQLAWFGGLSGVKARRVVKNSKAIAQGEEDTKFVTYIIANSSTGLSEKEKLSSEISGKTFTFGSKGSTSGRLMPEYYIRQNFKKSPSEIFKRVGYSGDHSKTIALVQSGSYEVGAVNYKVWEKELAAGLIDTAKVRVIWKTPTYPDYNWTIRGDVEGEFGDGFIEKVKLALLSLNDKKLLDSFPRTRFIEANNDLYEPILKTGLEIGIFDD